MPSRTQDFVLRPPARRGGDVPTPQADPVGETAPGFLDALRRKVAPRRARILENLPNRITEERSRLSRMGLLNTSSAIGALTKLYAGELRRLVSVWIRSVEEILGDEDLLTLPVAAHEIHDVIRMTMTEDCALLENQLKSVLLDLPPNVEGRSAAELFIGTTLNNALREIEKRLGRLDPSFDLRALRSEAERGKNAQETRSAAEQIFGHLRDLLGKMGIRV